MATTLVLDYVVANNAKGRSILSIAPRRQQLSLPRQMEGVAKHVANAGSIVRCLQERDAARQVSKSDLYLYALNSYVHFSCRCEPFSVPGEQHRHRVE